MSRGMVLITAALVAMTSACSEDGPEIGETTGSSALGTVEGEVLLSGDCPVLVVDEECPAEPFAATIGVEDLEGAELTVVDVGADGVLRVELPAGRYRLVPVQPTPGAPPVAEPQEITVASGATTTVTVLYDRGVR